MVGIKRAIITTFIALCALPCVAQSNLGTIAERQLRQLTLRSERIEAQLKSARENYSLAPCDSLGKVVFELEKQSAAIAAAIARITSPRVEIEKTAEVEDHAEPTLPQPVPEVEEQPEQEPEAEQIAEPATTPQPTPPVTEEPEPESTPATVEEVEVKVDEVPQSTTTQEVPMQESVEPREEETPALSTHEAPEADIAAQQDVISAELKKMFNTTIRRYSLVEGEIALLIGDYAKSYDEAKRLLKEYDNATSLKTLNTHLEAYNKAVEDGKKLADEIANRGDRLFESKMNALYGFADSLELEGTRDKYMAMAEETEATMSAKLSTICTDLDVAMYPHRLRTTMALHVELARHITPEDADSLELKLKEFDTLYALFEPLGKPKRSDAKFAPVKVVKSSKHGAVSALPVLKVPAEGELYSITVGNYASLPPSTKGFRNATPLYQQRREDGRTYIYVGLYPTARSAQEDIAYLRKLGFKQPELVMWRDGIRRDDFVDRTAKSATPRAAMYRVEIGGTQGTLPQSVVEAIRNTAPRKEISKFTNEGATVYTVGIFTKEGEAQALATAIGKADATLSASVVELGK